MLIRNATLIAFLSAASSPWAAPLEGLSEGFVARCSEPHGPSIEYGWLYRGDGEVIYSPDDGFRESTDGFSNMNPIFIYRPDEPRVILSIWGDTRTDAISPEILDKLADANFDRNIVISKTEDMISAVGRVGNEVWLSTLVPGLRVGYFSYHQVDHSSQLSAPAGAPDSSARSSALSARCEFSRLQE